MGIIFVIFKACNATKRIAYHYRNIVVYFNSLGCFSFVLTIGIPRATLPGNGARYNFTHSTDAFPIPYYSKVLAFILPS